MDERKTLILGLGNTILRDDGAGIYVAREIGKRVRNTDVVVKEASLGGLELLELMKGFDRVVLIDAILTGSHEVGSLIELTVDDLKGGSAMSRHQVSFSEALELGRKVGMDLPEEIRIYGIEVLDARTFTESCTDEVGKRISEIAEEIVHTVFVHDGQD
jgi:hydrogenase maturation protease